MRLIRLLPMAVYSVLAVQGVDAQQTRDAASASSVKLPPVLQRSEPYDSVVVMLPGSAASAIVSPGLPMTEVHLAPPAPDLERPVFKRPKREYPPEFEHDSSEYLMQKIGTWQQVDAQVMLGEPLRQRPAYSDEQTVNGQILAYLDPTGRYKEMELDFDSESGLLRTLFVYPYSMTWQDCRRTFGAKVESTQANKGRMFYSYLDRRLDVLVDPAGKVISLGMY